MLKKVKALTVNPHMPHEFVKLSPRFSEFILFNSPFFLGNKSQVADAVGNS